MVDKLKGELTADRETLADTGPPQVELLRSEVEAQKQLAEEVKVQLDPKDAEIAKLSGEAEVQKLQIADAEAKTGRELAHLQEQFDQAKANLDVSSFVQKPASPSPVI